MENKGKYKKYYQEVITKLKREITEIEARLVKAETLGADKPDHKFHGAYEVVKSEWNRQNDFLTEYSQKLEQLDR